MPNVDRHDFTIVLRTLQPDSSDALYTDTLNQDESAEWIGQWATALLIEMGYGESSIAKEALAEQFDVVAQYVTTLTGSAVLLQELAMWLREQAANLREASSSQA